MCLIKNITLKRNCYKNEYMVDEFIEIFYVSYSGKVGILNDNIESIQGVKMRYPERLIMKTWTARWTTKSSTLLK